jgi:cytochrome bd-type quinol oxidase subunit 2
MKTFLVFLFLFAALPVYAQTGQNSTVEGELLEQLQFTGRSAEVAGPNRPQDPRIIAASIIKVALSLLGTVFFILMIYAGFLWMTARGEEAKVEKAQSTIRRAVIGLAIVMGAYAATIFITQSLLSGPGSEPTCNWWESC